MIEDMPGGLRLILVVCAVLLIPAVVVGQNIGERLARRWHERTWFR